MRFLPRPVQRPGVPVWVGGYRGKVKPLRRAARYQGYFPIGVDSPDQIAEAAAQLVELRRRAGVDAGTFDVVISLPPGEDPAPYAAAGATWRFTRFPESVTADRVWGVLRDGP
jgi:alkanesulfonate monooxygenase SsuD/methylene tetrahydromethanopterin reductase-like flavin-dependent oxidoreductase (luciferase family)